MSFSATPYRATPRNGNGLVQTPRRVFGSGAASSTSGQAAKHKAAARTTDEVVNDWIRLRDGNVTAAASAAVGPVVESNSGPAARRLSPEDADHEAALLARQEMHSTMFAATGARRERAEAVTEILQRSVVALEATVRDGEQRVQALEAERKALADQLRAEELESYRATKELQAAERALATATPSVDGLLSPARLHASVRSHGAPATRAVLRQREIEGLYARLSDAERIGADLRRQCEENEALVTRRREERAALKELLAAVEGHLEGLERAAPDVAAKLRAARMLLHSAGDHHQQLPEMRRAAADNDAALVLLREDSAKALETLMARIRTDDAAIAALRLYAGPAPTLVGALSRDLEDELRALDTSIGDAVARAEQQQTRLEAATDALRQQVEYFEEQLKRHRTAENS